MYTQHIFKMEEPTATNNTHTRKYEETKKVTIIWDDISIHFPDENLSNFIKCLTECFLKYGDRLKFNVITLRTNNETIYKLDTLFGMNIIYNNDAYQAFNLITNRLIDASEGDTVILMTNHLGYSKYMANAVYNKAVIILVCNKFCNIDLWGNELWNDLYFIEDLSNLTVPKLEDQNQQNFNRRVRLIEQKELEKLKI